MTLFILLSSLCGLLASVLVGGTGGGITYTVIVVVGTLYTIARGDYATL